MADSQPSILMARAVSPAMALFRGGLALYDYQEETLARLIESESAGHPDDVALHVTGRTVLTEPFGSGKTFIILALIMRSPIPQIRNVDLRDQVLHAPYLTIDVASYDNQIIRPTAIVVGRSVYSQWVRNIATYTGLRVFEARDRPAIVKLAEAINRTGDINDYDIVLIKHGRTFTSEGDIVSLTKIINRATGSRVWARVVYDDVDLVADCSCLRAISSVFVTGASKVAYEQISESRAAISSLETFASRKLHQLLVKLPLVSHVYVRDPAEQRMPGRYHSDYTLWRTCGHDPETIARNHGVYAISWYECAITNHEITHATVLIENTEASNREELMRMINGDAMTSAARMLNVTRVITPYAMFASVLGAQRADYEIAVARRRAFDMILAVPYEERSRTEESRFDGMGMELEHRAITRADIIERIGIPPELLARANERSHGLEDVATVSAMITAPVDMIEEARAHIVDVLARLDRSFERIGENLASRACSVCFNEFGAAGDARKVTIMRCCGYVLCAECCIRGSKFMREDGGAHPRVVGRCIQCRSALDLARDVVHIDSGVNPADLVEVALRESRAGVFVAPPSAADAAANARARERAIADIHSKTMYVIALIQGNLPHGPVETEHMTVRARAQGPEVVGLMVGTQMVPARESRVIVCSSFDETLTDISVGFIELGIEFAILHGSVREFTDTVASFVDGRVRILLINTRALFAGVDLQCATDIVMMDGERTENFGQVIGRAQRIGRTCSLTVHMLSYVDEDKGELGDAAPAASAAAALAYVSSARIARLARNARMPGKK